MRFPRDDNMQIISEILKLNGPAQIVPRKFGDMKHNLEYVCGAIGVKESYMFSSF